MMRVADYIMERLCQEGVTHVFQVTGRGSLFLSDGLAKNTNLNAISLHHEQSCAFAAIGFAERSGGLGAALVSTGCASTNTLTGVLSAWQDGVPCIFISGQNILKETSRYTGINLRTYGQQEADIVKIVTPITKYAHMLTKSEDIVEVMNQAITSALSGRKGPVWIDVPLDLQSALINPSSLQSDMIGLSVSKPIASDDDIKAIIKLFNSAIRPIVLIGKGIRASNTEQEFANFVKKHNLPVTFTASATDTFGAWNSMSIGSVGAMGCSRAGNFAIANADFVLVLGSRLNSLNTGPDYCDFAREAKVVVVDIDAVEHSKISIKIDQFIHTDLKVFFKLIEHSEFNSANIEWVERCLYWKKLFTKIEPNFQSQSKVDLYQLADSLSNLLPRSSTIVLDSGLAEVILPTNILFGEGMHCVHPTSQGAMGFALPASIGVQYVSKEPVLVVVGDGSIMMNLQELESIRYQKLPIKIIVINNNVYSIIRKRQKDLFRTRTIGTDPGNGTSCPDFRKVAECFDLNYIKIETIKNLNSGLIDLFKMEGPVLCEIMGVEDQGYIEVGNARSEVDRRIVRRPLEDQMPFLDRQLFLNEMIINPIKQ
jgi:acetolactate synthase-1/2/3 large subunit